MWMLPAGDAFGDRVSKNLEVQYKVSDDLFAVSLLSNSSVILTFFTTLFLFYN